MKEATTKIKAENTTKTPNSPMPSTFAVIILAAVCNNPELLTALPSASPPAASMMMVQRKLLKSSFVKTPVPKNSTIGMRATTPMSPTTPAS